MSTVSSPGFSVRIIACVRHIFLHANAWTHKAVVCCEWFAAVHQWSYYPANKRKYLGAKRGRCRYFRTFNVFYFSGIAASKIIYFLRWECFVVFDSHLSMQLRATAVPQPAESLFSPPTGRGDSYGRWGWFFPPSPQPLFAARGRAHPPVVR